MSVTLTFDAARRENIAGIRLLGRASLGDYWRRQTARRTRYKSRGLIIMARHGPTPHSTARQAARQIGYCLRVQPGDRVAFQLPGWCEYPHLSLACLKTRARYLSATSAARSGLVWVLNINVGLKYSSPPPCSNRIDRSILSFATKSAP